MSNERLEILISGVGGQGAVLLGTVLGASAANEGKYATQAPSYGTETRGSPAESQVVISPKKIGFPEVEKIDVFVAMTQTALNRHKDELRRESRVIVDPDLVRTIPATIERVWRIPAAKLSEQHLASRNYANIVMFGALVKLTGVVSYEAARNAIRTVVPSDTMDRNLSAFEIGVKAADQA